MAHPIHNVEYLSRLPFAQIKKIGAELGIQPVDKRVKDCWIHAIASHQQAQIKKVENAAADAIDTLSEWMDAVEPTEEEIQSKAELSEEACEFLNLRIYDLELEYGDVVLPSGAIVYTVYDCFGHHEGNIFKADGGKFETERGSYNDHWTAALSLVSDLDCCWAMAEVVAKREQRESLPEYF